MTALREAAQQALGALEESLYATTDKSQFLAFEAITALRAALAEHFCDTHCTWADHATGCVRAEPALNPAPGYCKHCKQYTIEEPLPAEPVQEPVAGNWSVFNTGAEVFSGMSMPEAVAELTPARLERGWSAVCVINKDNPPTYAPPQRKPLSEEALSKIIDAEIGFNSCCGWEEAFARAVEAAHGIKEGT